MTVDNKTLQALLGVLTDEQKAQLLNQLQGSDTAEIPDAPEVETVSTGVRVREDFTVDRSTTFSERARRPVRAKKNQWKDRGESRDETFDAAHFEKLGRADRRTSQPKKVDVTCHICGKSFTLPASSVYGEFIRCNRCTGK